MTWSINAKGISKLYKLGKQDTAVEVIHNRFKRIFKGKNKSLSASSENESQILETSQFEDAPSGYFWALKDVSFSINKGERVGIIGQNGSGKSTLLKILSRITVPSQGQFQYKGRLVSLLEVGTGFHPELSGRENIFLNGSIMGMSPHQIEATYEEIVAFSEIGTMIDTPVKRYSSGMYIRLAFSIAAHLVSDILIVDEVLAVGDAGFQKKCMDKMLDISNDGGRTLIFVSHDMGAVNKICDRVIELSHGKVKQQGDLGKLSANRATMNYLSSVRKINPEIHWLENGYRPQLGNVVSLSSVKICNNDGVICDSFDVSEPIKIIIEYVVASEEVNFNIHMTLMDFNGNCILVSMDNHETSMLSVKRSRGAHQDSCVISPSFLNTGLFSVGINLYSNPTNVVNPVKFNDLVSFSVKDEQVVGGVRGDWPNEWPTALLRPKLEWSISTDSNMIKLGNRTCFQTKDKVLDTYG